MSYKLLVNYVNNKTFLWVLDICLNILWFFCFEFVFIVKTTTEIVAKSKILPAIKNCKTYWVKINWPNDSISENLSNLSNQFV